MIDTRRPSLRSLLAALLAALICLGASGAPPLEARDSDTNAAVAVNEEDGSSVFEVAFDIRRVSSGVVDQTNAAVAYASCESCQTVAIAIQIVLVSGTVDTVTPTNLAIALNEECTSCQTLALAYQFVFGTGDQIGFTGQGNRRLREISRELRGLSREDLTNDEIGARVLDLTDQIRDVLATEVVTRGERRGRGPRGERGRDDDDERGGPRDPPRTVPEEPAPDDEVGPPDDDQPLREEESGEEPAEPPDESAPPTGSPGQTAPTPPSNGSEPDAGSTDPAAP